MKRIKISWHVACCVLAYSMAYAVGALPAQPPPSGTLLLLPSSDITLVAGEEIGFTIFDDNAHEAVAADKVTWKVNGQPVGKIDAALMVSKGPKAAFGYNSIGIGPNSNPLARPSS